MRCPKCGYENKDDAVACLMCYAMLKVPEGEGKVKTKPEAKPKVKIEPKPSAPTPPPVTEAVTSAPPLPEEPPIAEEPPLMAEEETPRRVSEPKAVSGEKGFIGTWLGVITSPSEFFSRMDITSGLSKAYVFALLNALILGAGVFVGMSGGWIKKLSSPAMPVTFSLMGLILFLLFWAVVFSNLIFIQAGVLNICAKLLLGKGKYKDTFKVIAYAGSINVVGWIPGINVLAVFWGLYIIVIGLKKVHGFSGGKAVLALLLPVLLGLAIAGVMLTLTMVG